MGGAYGSGADRALELDGDTGPGGRTRLGQIWEASEGSWRRESDRLTQLDPGKGCARSGWVER